MKYTEEEKINIFNEIIALMITGLSLRKAIELNDKIRKNTFLEWIAKDVSLATQYARAMELRADAIFEEMIDIADDGTNDWMEYTDKNGETAYSLNGEHVQRSKLRLDARKWMLAKMQPKKYGDKIDLTTDGQKLDSAVTIFQIPDDKRN